jgi:hypothetical protein
MSTGTAGVNMTAPPPGAIASNRMDYGGPTGHGAMNDQGWMFPSGGYNPGASSGTAGLYGDPSMYSGGAMPMGYGQMEQAMTQGRGIGPLLPPGFGGGGRTPINPGGGFPVNVNPGNRPNSVSQWAGMQQGYAPFQGNYGGMPYDMSGMAGMFNPGINYGTFY